jgi:uncharacterized damage-inducible protein DinB
MTPEAVRKLFDYTYWAFERVWDCVVQLTDEQFTQDIGYSFGSIRNLVVHLMSSHHRWMKRLQGVEIPPHLAFEEYATRAATRAKWDKAKSEFINYVYSLDQTQLDEKVHYEIAGRGIRSDDYRWELLMHLANHATDHRAQILAILHHHFGVKTVEQDLIFYLWEEHEKSLPA